MSTGQSQIKIKVGNALDRGATTSNVATNKAELEALAAANVDGKDTYPQSVSTQRLQVAQTLSIGDQVQMTDGCVSAEHLASGSVTTEKLNCTDVTTSNISFSGGSLSEFGVSTLGSITGGSLSVGADGVTISADGGTSGVYIGGNVISCIYGGSPTFHVDGTTGIVTATKFQMTADGDSSLDMTAGSLTIGSTTAVDDGGAGYTVADIYSNAAQAISDAATAQGTADGKVTTFYQDNAPTAEATGDLWVDTNDSNKLYRWNGSSWVSVRDSGIAQAISDAADAQSTADGKIVTFYQTSAPSGASAGDLWVETDNNNKLWRYSGSSWQSAQDAGAAAGASAVQPGNGFGVNASKEPSTILLNSGGIEISTASSGARLLLDNDGLSAKAYISYAYRDVVTLDSTYGIRVINHSATDNVAERVSVCYDSGSGATEQGRLVAYSNYVLLNAMLTTLRLVGGEVLIESDDTGNIFLGSTSYPATVTIKNTLAFSNGATFTSGSGNPTSTPSEYGSLYTSDGGSLWIYTTAGWKRIWHDGVQPGTVAHTHS